MTHEPGQKGKARQLPSQRDQNHRTYLNYKTIFNAGCKVALKCNKKGMQLFAKTVTMSLKNQRVD